MTAEPQSYRKTARTTLARQPMRAGYDKDVVHAILDSNALCQIGYVADGQPLVLPTIYWRMGEEVFWHGSRQGRALQAMAQAQVCFSVCRLDGLVLARSAFRHSANYRSVMAFGAAREVGDEAGKLAALKGVIDKLYPGRWDRIRPPNRAELSATSVLRLRLDEVSSKVRTGPPLDLEGDLDLPVWAGVATVELGLGGLQPCQRSAAGSEAGEPEIDWTAMAGMAG
jgi:nitroimidazol reductase NimA-like FMN-containing flavoprotein (pyridoxamine 5'-phosphate oxidase superfamily)